MSRTIIVRDQDEERVYASEDLPLVVGGGPDAQIPVADHDDGGPLALLGISDDRPFVQPGTGGEPVFYNERPIETSRWLSHGDSVRVDHVRIHCEFVGDRLELRVSRVPLHTGEWDSDVPLLATEEIEPVVYEGAVGGPTARLFRIRPLPIVISAFFLRSA